MPHAQVPVDVLGEGVVLQVALVEPPPHRMVAFGPVARGGSATRTLKVLVCSDRTPLLLWDCWHLPCKVPSQAEMHF